MCVIVYYTRVRGRAFRLILYPASWRRTIFYAELFSFSPFHFSFSSFASAHNRIQSLLWLVWRMHNLHSRANVSHWWNGARRRADSFQVATKYYLFYAKKITKYFMVYSFHLCKRTHVRLTPHMFAREFICKWSRCLIGTPHDIILLPLVVDVRVTPWN